MTKTQPQVLLLEDDQDDILVIQEVFSAAENGQFVLNCINDLAAGLDYLAENSVDVLLLDLNLPDSSGKASLLRVRERFPQLPVIVLTGLDDEKAALDLVHHGAQDYLVKGLETQHVLVRAIRYALERQSLLLALEDARQNEREAHEYSHLEKFILPAATSITAQSFGQLPLHESAPGLFDEIMLRYATLLDDALEQHAFHVENSISINLGVLAEKLCFLRASARDVIELHTLAIKLKCQSAGLPKRQAYLDEGRLMLVELMGKLLMCYRSYFSRLRSNATSKEL